MPELEKRSRTWTARELLDYYPSVWVVDKVRERKQGKILELVSLAEASASRQVEVSPYTYVFARDAKEDGTPRVQDFLLVNHDNSLIQKVCDDGCGGLALCTVKPYFTVDEVISLAKGTSLSLRCGEVIELKDFEAVRWLNTFHYRSLSMWGRSTALVLRLAEPDVSRPHEGAIGYIMLNSPPLLTRPRDELMEWDADARLAHVDRVVRIARVVVHPEFRSLGLGALLVRRALDYAETHWNAAGKKPVLVETVAEMSRLHPVFAAGGMTYAGETLGRDEVLVTPTEKLTHEMGAGHWRSSLDRMKMTPSAPKPYFAAALANCPSSVRDRLDNWRLQPDPTTPPNLPQLKPPVIRFTGATVSFNGTGSSPREFSRLLGFDRVDNAVGHASNRLGESARILCEDIDTLVQVEFDPIRRFAHLAGSYAEELVRTSKTVLASEETIEETSRKISADLQRLDELRAALLLSLESSRAELDAAIAEAHASDPKRHAELSAMLHRVGQLQRKLRSRASSSREADVLSAFGLDGTGASSKILDRFTFDILPGQVVLIEGASGSGKTSILDVLMRHTMLTDGTLEPEDLAEHVAAIDLNFDEHLAVIDLVGTSTREACLFLNAAGISEAKVYLKRRSQLSHGQRYRVAAAMLASSRKPVWLADEFCAFLDPLTSVMVARGIGRLARKTGATLIVASADSGRIRAALNPDVWLRLVSGGRPVPDLAFSLWNSRVLAALRAEAGTRKDAAKADLRLRSEDLIYHRTHSHAIEAGSQADLAGAVVADLKRISPWSEGILTRQVQLRVKFYAELQALIGNAGRSRMLRR